MKYKLFIDESGDPSLSDVNTLFPVFVLLGFLIKEAGWFSSPQILPLYSVKALGSDAIIVPSRAAICPVDGVGGRCARGAHP